MQNRDLFHFQRLINLSRRPVTKFKYVFLIQLYHIHSMHGTQMKKSLKIDGSHHYWQRHLLLKGTKTDLCQCPQQVKVNIVIVTVLITITVLIMVYYFQCTLIFSPNACENQKPSILCQFWIIAEILP